MSSQDQDNSSQDQDNIQRNVLPIPDQPYVGLTTYDAKDPETKYPPIQELRPPKGAPNVLIILIDDAGFGSSSVFGGPCRTPNLKTLADNGLKYTRFHTTSLCSPTRQALLTGRNHHSAGMGAITEMATAAPGQCSFMPNTISPLARTLKLNGYSTAQFGKCHEVPVWQTSPMGPFDAWPSGGGGFEYFYGFIGGETNQYYPAIYEGTTPVEPEKTPGESYHFTEDMTTKAIKWISQQKALMPDKPFFVYFAPGATHAPHHVPAKWADDYKGEFDQGWDKLREETFERQKALGVIPEDCQLTQRHDGIPAWDDFFTGKGEEGMKKVLARQMEIYAGYLTHTDAEIGKLLACLKGLEILDDTLIYAIIGDNGASAEGSQQGAFNEMVTLTGYDDLETPDFLKEHLEEFGGPKAYNHYAVGWAHAMNTPYQWTKQVASHWGGTRNGTIVHWPARIKVVSKEKGANIRNQFHHVIDVAPTILEAAGLPQPLFVNGVQQRPIEGVSMLYSFDDANAAERHETQYFEMMGNRGIYHKGWTAVTKHRIPWETGAQVMPAFDDDVWELYDTNVDWTQANDLTKSKDKSLRNVKKLHDLQRLWLIEAVKYNVLPLDDRFAERSNPEIAGRPQLITGNRQVLYGGMGRLSESSIVNFKNKSHTITAKVSVPPGKAANGVIIAQGGHTGGWSLYAKEGFLKYCYNFYGVTETLILGNGKKIPTGNTDVRMEFKYTGGNEIGKGGTVTLYVGEDYVGEGELEETEPMMFSADETCDIGCEAGSPVTEDYPPNGSKFSGEVNEVEIVVHEPEAPIVIPPELRLRLAMGVQ